MSSSGRHTLTIAAAMATGVALACLLGCALGPESLRGVLLTGSLATGLIATGLAGFMLYRGHREARVVARYLDALARLEARELSSESLSLELPPLSGHDGVATAASRACGKLVGLARRNQELEHTQTVLDVRARRATAEAEQIRAVFAGLSDPVLVIDENENLALANASARHLFGIAGNLATMPQLEQAIGNPLLAELLTGTLRRKASGPRSEEMEIPDGEGRTRWYRATAARLAAQGEDGRGARGAVVVLRDIADQRALQKRNAEFVSAVSHEMKTPLAGIRAYVELLADGDAEDEATREEFLEVIHSQAERLQRLIDNLLNLARIEAGVVHVNKQPRSLNEILEEALRVVQPTAEAKQIELHEELSPLYLGVLADRDMLLQAAINLLSNAIKYTDRGGSVTLCSRMEDNEVRFEVRDTGVGLSEEDARKVFEKFYRVKKNTDMAPGTGLGLPLAKHIVEDVHGGRIEVHSAPGEGSTFAVVLPAAGMLAPCGT